MKRRARQHGSGSPHSTGLQQLEGLPLRLIALKLSDPGPLTLSCTAAHRSIISGGDFDDEWFLRWVHVLVPLRPWQYAAVGWRRLGGQHATTEQLCAFILRISAAKLAMQKQQDALRAQHASTAPPTATAAAQGSPEHPDTLAQQAQPDPAQQQQPHPEQEGVPATGSTAKPALPRSRFSPMPHLAPLPSVLRQVQKLLVKGDAARALALLCPAHLCMLFPYAAAAGNAQLLEQLISACTNEMGAGHYPWHCMSVSGGGCRMVSAAQAAAYAAMRKGHTSVLAMLLLSGGSSIRSRPYQLGQLFRFAVRHSNAACIQQLLAFAPCMDHNGSPKLTPWPQHLAMAAARVDPWAGEVVGLLLRVMNRKLLAAKYMGPVYTAACRAGHMPVLQQLVQQLVESSPAAHWPVVLKAAALAGTRSIWQQLLGPHEGHQDSNAAAAVLTGPAAAAAIPAPVHAPAAGPSRAGSGLLSYLSRWFTAQPTLQQHQQQPHQQPLQQQQPQQEQQGLWHLPQLPSGCLSEHSCWPVLLALLNGCCLGALHNGSGLRLAADSDRLAMADAFWELLGKQGWQDAVRTTAQLQLCADVAPWASYGGVQQLLVTAPHNKLVWMLQHDMLPQLPAGWLVAPAAAEGLQARIRFCLKYGQRQAAAALWQLSKQLQVQVPVRDLVQGCLDGAVHQAAAAHRIEDLQQQALMFAQYHASLCGDVATPHCHHGIISACNLQGAEHNPLERLLSVLSCVWNAAAVMHTRGLPQQLGIPWQQHLRLCASAALPWLLQALLPHVPTSTVLEVFEVAASPALATPSWLDSLAQVVVQLQPLLQQGNPQAQHAAAAAGSGADPGSDSDSETACQAGLMKGFLQLSWMCQKWRSQGLNRLMFPMGGELAFLPLGSAAVYWVLDTQQDIMHLFNNQALFDKFVKDLLCDMRALPVPVGVMRHVAAAVATLRAASEHAAAAADITAAPAGQRNPARPREAPARSTRSAVATGKGLSALKQRPAAAVAGPGQMPARKQAATAAGTSAAAAGGSQTAPCSFRNLNPFHQQSLMYTLSSLLIFSKRQVPPSAAAAVAVAQAAVSSAAAWAAAQAIASAALLEFEASLAAAAAPTGTPAAAVATLAAQDSTEAGIPPSSSSGVRKANRWSVPPLWQLAALALPVSEFVSRPLTADPDTALEAVLRPFVEGSSTPAFLAGCCSSSSEAGVGSCSHSSSGSGVSAATGVAAGPSPPPEHEVIKLVLGNSVWLRHMACTWSGCLHRADAAAWALHPRQEHLWAHPLNRQLLAMFLKSSLAGIMPRYGNCDPLLWRAHEHQLWRHQQTLAAGVTWGDVSSGGGVLPRFVTGAADAATALLADSQPVAISRSVQMLSGGSSVACVEYVKGVLAAVLATPAEQIKAVDAQWYENWLQVSVGAVRKATEVGDMDLLALVVLLDVQAWCIRPSNFWLFGG